MSLFRCFPGRHRALPSKVRNQGLYFSSCRKCGIGMVRSGWTWRTVPRGFRIVWRRVERFAPADPEAIRNRPAAVRSRAVAVAARRRGLGIGDLISIGVQLLAWYGADGLKRWQAKLSARLLGRRAVPLLLAH